MKTDLPLVCLSTAPSTDVAEQLARALVERRLAACVSFVPGAKSLYRWKGDVCADNEIWMMIKTTPECWEALLAAWQNLHPYEVPELLALPVAAGFQPYVEWVFASVNAGDPS